MKKIFIKNTEIFEIAKTIKTFIPDLKINIHFYDSKIVINFPKIVERLKVEELKVLFKIKYPNHQIVFNFNNHTTF